MIPTESDTLPLLDLAEKFGAASAGPRLVEREAKQKELLAQMRQLESQQAAQRLTVPLETIQAILVEMRETLSGTDCRAKRALLKKLVAWVELDKDRGKVAYTFPLRDADLYTVPPGGCCTKNRTMEYGMDCRTGPR